jgi:hypothetical protein
MFVIGEVIKWVIAMHAMELRCPRARARALAAWNRLLSHRGVPCCAVIGGVLQGLSDKGLLSQWPRS